MTLTLGWLRGGISPVPGRASSVLRPAVSVAGSWLETRPEKTSADQSKPASATNKARARS